MLTYKGPCCRAPKEHRYMLLVVDEFSRSPFAFPTAEADTSTDSAVQCLTSLFPVFGTPEFAHSDQGTAFTSFRFKQPLLQNNIAQSFRSAYNAPGNGQTERYSGIIWRSVCMACHSEDIDLKKTTGKPASPGSAQCVMHIVVMHSY